jgi:hypothetical protein
MSMNPTQADLAFLTMTDDELLLVMGNHLTAGSFGSKEASDDEKRQMARRWFDAYIEQVRPKICGNSSVRALLGKESQDRNGLFCLVFDILISNPHLGVPAGTLASRILNMGLAKLCPDWK